MANIPMGILAAGALSVPATISYVTRLDDTTNASTYTFTATDIGAADANRKVIIVAFVSGSSSTGAITGITAGGNAMNEVVTATEAGGTLTGSIRELDIATGTTTEFIVSTTGTAARCTIAVYRGIGAAASATDTHGSSTTTSSSSTTYALNIPAGGIALAGRDAGFSSVTVTWAGLTEDFDVVGGEGEAYSGASDAFAAEQVGLSVTATPSASSPGTFLVASFGPA